MHLIALIVVVYIVCSGLLWFCAYLLAPVGYQISLWRCLGTAVLLTVAEKAIAILQPWIGDWYLLVMLVAFVLIIRFMLRLPFWRSVLTMIIYATVVGSIGYFFLGKRPNHAPLQRTARLRSYSNAKITGSPSLILGRSPRVR
jgi:hypothetical protein